MATTLRSATFRSTTLRSTTLRRWFLAFPLLVVTACASAEDRFNEGIQLQAQGRYMEAAYRYADAVEKDATLQEARDRLLVVGDSAVMLALEESDRLAGLGEPVEEARQYHAIDRLMSRVRSVGMRLVAPADYRASRRAAFDTAIEWYMTEGEAASREGRWQDAIGAFASVRGDFSPSREVREASLDAETRVLIDWAEITLGDRRPRAAFGIAERALSVRRPAARAIVLEVQDLQARALSMGTVVLASLPMTASEGVRLIAPDLEVEIDQTMESGHWGDAPPFVQMADANILRRELRGLLRGVIPQSPALVGRALNLIGADYGVMVEVTSLRITDEPVRVEEFTTEIRRQDLDASRAREQASAREACVGPGRGQDRGRGVGLDPDDCRGRGWGNGRRAEPRSDGNSSQRWITYEIGDVATYRVISGDRVVDAEADVLLIDLDGRAIAEFTITSTERGPFREGEFDGDPWQLGLSNRDARMFEWGVWDEEWGRIERAVVRELADGIATETFREVLSRVP